MNSTYFVQECPTCGRRLQIRVEYLGKSVVCQHCRGRLTACDPTTNRCGDLPDALLRRVEELIETASHPATQTRLIRPR